MPLHDKDSVRDNLEDEVYASADLSVTLAVHLRGADADPLVHHRATRRAQDPWAPSLSQQRPGPRAAVSRRRALSSRFLSRPPLAHPPLQRLGILAPGRRHQRAATPTGLARTRSPGSDPSLAAANTLHPCSDPTAPRLFCPQTTHPTHAHLTQREFNSLSLVRLRS